MERSAERTIPRRTMTIRVQLGRASSTSTAKRVLAILASIVMLVFSLTGTLRAQQLGDDLFDADGIGSGGIGSDDSLGGMEENQLQQLGLPMQQLKHLREQAGQGGLGNTDLQKLCAGVAAKRVPAEQIESIGRSLGLPDDDVSRLIDCARFSPQRGNQADSPFDNGNNYGYGRTPNPYTGPSAVERNFHDLESPYKMLAAPKLNTLEQFGYRIFSNRMPSALLTSSSNEPVSGDYTVGPGDELNVLLWGRINKTLRLRVQRDGTVLIPQIGPLPVAGTTFAQAQKLISGQINQIEGVQSDVTMGRLRTIQVFVIGQVARPGVQTVSALAHLSDALNAAGGVQKTGSLRRIELRRGNRLVKFVDLYAMLLHGDISADDRLQARDVVFVPVIGPVAGVAGDVRNPAIYEITGRQKLGAVIKMAGGVGAFGYAHRIQVQQVENHQRRIALDVSLDSPTARRFTVNDGDLIKVFTVLPEERNVVKLQGNANRPGTYEWTQGMRVVDLIRAGQGLKDHTFFDYALVNRHEGPAHTAHSLRVNLGEAIANETSVADLMLQPQDTLTIYSEGEISQIPTVTVSGEVGRPGTYPLTTGMRISDLIYKAGGLKDNAYLASAQLARTRVQNGSATLHLFEDINLNAALEGSAADNLTLQRDDKLAVVQAANWHHPWTVQVKGEAMRPGPYVISDGETLASVLQRCGGIRPDGYLSALVLTRESVKRMQQQNLKRASGELQTELTRALLMPMETTQIQQQPNFQDKAAALTMLKNMITEAAQQQAIGRVTLTIKSIPQLQASGDDIPLEDNDQIIVPKRPSSVNVMGEVYGPGAIRFDSSLTVADYIDRAGGLTQSAEKDEIFVVKANGAILSESGLKDSGKNRIFPLLPLVSRGLTQTYLEPGDTIYVPVKLLFVNPLQRTLAITQIVANTAQGIAYAALLGTLLP